MVRVHDMADGRLIGLAGPGRCAGISENGQLLLCDGDAGYEVLSFDAAQKAQRRSRFPFPWQTAPADKRAVDLSPDAQHAVITRDRRRWEVFALGEAAGKNIGALAHDAECPLYTFSLDGRLFATASARGGRERGSVIAVWELATARKVSTFATLQDTVRLEFSPDGRLLACGGATSGFLGGAVAVHRSEDGQLAAPYLTHRGNIEDLEFSPDGRHLATSSRDSVARVWEVATGKLAAPELVHTHHVGHLSFDRAGKSLVTTTTKRPTLRVWDLVTGEAITPPLRLDRGTTLSRFTDDGTALITAGKVFMRWPLTEEGRTADDLVREAEFLCGRRHDPLTGERPIALAELQDMRAARTTGSNEQRPK
jgi:WD40 repeat protein